MAPSSSQSSYPEAWTPCWVPFSLLFPTCYLSMSYINFSDSSLSFHPPCISFSWSPLHLDNGKSYVIHLSHSSLPTLVLERLKKKKSLFLKILSTIGHYLQTDTENLLVRTYWKLFQFIFRQLSPPLAPAPSSDTSWTPVLYSILPFLGPCSFMHLSLCKWRSLLVPLHHNYPR